MTFSSPYIKFIDIYRQLLALDEKEHIGSTLKNIQELLTFTDKVFSSPAVAEVFLYFCIHGSATAWVLQNELQMPEATAYRALKRLRSMKIVIPALKISKLKTTRGGPRPTAWALETADDMEVATALRLHYKLLSPKYCVAERIAQTILEEYTEKQLKEISYKLIVDRVKELRAPFRTPDVANLAATYLHEQGIKVWR